MRLLKDVASGRELNILPCCNGPSSPMTRRFVKTQALLQS